MNRPPSSIRGITIIGVKANPISTVATILAIINPKHRT